MLVAVSEGCTNIATEAHIARRTSSCSVHKEIVDAIHEYRAHTDLSRLLSITTPKMEFVAQCFGYAAGYLAARDVTLEQEAPDEYRTLFAVATPGGHENYLPLQNIASVRDPNEV